MTINSLSGEIRTSFRNSGRLREHPKGGVPAEQDYLRSAGGELVRPYRFNVRFQLAVVWVIRKLARASGRPPCNHPPVISREYDFSMITDNASSEGRAAGWESIRRIAGRLRKKEKCDDGENEGEERMMKGKEIGKMKEGNRGG